MLLFIDTSTERGVIAIYENGERKFYRELPFGLNNSTHLLPVIDEGFKSLNITSKELKAIGVGVGPGSYTGVRVGVTVAKSFAFALKIPLVSVSSLYGFIPDQDGIFAAIIDAKVRGAYVVKGERKNGIVQFLTKPKVVALEHLQQEVGDATHFISPKKDPLQEKISQADRWQWIERAPCVDTYVEHCRKKLAVGDFSFSIDYGLD